MKSKENMEEKQEDGLNKKKRTMEKQIAENEVKVGGGRGGDV